MATLAPTKRLSLMLNFLQSTNSQWHVRALLWGLMIAIFPLAALAADDVELGRRIYREGKLPSGQPLQGKRFDEVIVSGPQAACVNCHRSSGMGAVEGNLLVPPITGKFLFPSDEVKVATMDQRRRKTFNQLHAPYTEESFANALRSGQDVSGRQMQVVMPQYALSDQDVRALSAYLKQLSAEVSPGVTQETIRFATVIAPGVDDARRKAMLDTLRAAFAQKNGSTATGKRHMVSPAEMMMRSERNWILDIWELQGAPESWATQLADLHRRQPVFALVSGISDSTWQPVHEFCHRNQVPCWFPSVDMPVVDDSFYSVYFSRGVALEAEVLARHLGNDTAKKPQRLVQVYQDNAVGRGAAQALSVALTGTGIAVDSRMLASTQVEPISAQLKKIAASASTKDALMFWLPDAEVHALDAVPPPLGEAYFSSELGKLQLTDFPAQWKHKAKFVYPYELPEKRQANLAFFRAWLLLRRLPLVDEALQSEAYFAVAFLSETLAEMLHNVHRDYLLERAEEMLGKRENSKAEEEGRAREYLGRPGDMTRKYGTARRLNETQNLMMPDPAASAMPSGEVRRESTTVYPRLSLSQHQRFASKGAYILRFDSEKSGHLVAESDWIIP